MSTTHTKSSFLRLHTEDSATTSTRRGETDWLSDLRGAFAQATGWTLEWAEERPAAKTRPRRSRGAPAPSRPLGLRLGAACDSELSAPTTLSPTMPRAAAQQLVQSFNRLVTQCTATQSALRQREAELAAAFPTGERREERRQLAERLESLLHTATEYVGATSAAAYLLDENTSQLKLRSVWGLSADRLCEPARPLRGQLADLEALLGRAVVIRDTKAAIAWRPPESCGAAICVPISTSALPLGTMWVFADKPRDFTAPQCNVLEIIAGRLALELERDSLLRDLIQTQQTRRQWQSAVQWQRRRSPSPEPLAAGWQIASWTPAADRLAGEFCDWELLTDGSATAQVARADGLALEAGLTAAALHGALKAHLANCREPKQLLTRLNDTAWRSSAGDATSSLASVRWNPDSGEFLWAAAGDVSAVLIRDRSVLLRTADSAKLGENPDATFRLQKMTVRRGETLVICAAPMTSGKATKKRGEGRGERTSTRGGNHACQFPLSAEALAKVVREHSTESGTQLIERIQDAARDANPTQSEPHALLLIRREPTP